VLAGVQRFLDKSAQTGCRDGYYGTGASPALVRHRITENVLGEGASVLPKLVVDGRTPRDLSTPEGAYGGHLEPGCKAYVLCEIFFAEVEGVRLARRQETMNVPGMGEGRVTRLYFNGA
jgi:hypothetical protein